MIQFTTHKKSHLSLITNTIIIYYFIFLKTHSPNSSRKNNKKKLSVNVAVMSPAASSGGLFFTDNNSPIQTAAGAFLCVRSLFLNCSFYIVFVLAANVFIRFAFIVL
jgi:hypothetical protein